MHTHIYMYNTILVEYSHYFISAALLDLDKKVACTVKIKVSAKIKLIINWE